ncbi:MAG: 30S ribosomal protein S6 [Saprospiraceae bacterium]|nr:30S ribosomal protein S6 [Saprospiraceae bacterium]MBP7699587.1 30S ribosomal protein S6 [Saprospiraceae bacterium]
MRHYEVTFIVNPILSGDELAATAQSYIDLIEKEEGKIIHVDEMGLRQLAYPIEKKHSGVYYCIEFATENTSVIAKLELTMKRDENRIMRYLTTSLDKFGVKYNEDKRAGKIGKKQKLVKNRRGQEAATTEPEAKVEAPLVEASKD